MGAVWGICSSVAQWPPRLKEFSSIASRDVVLHSSRVWPTVVWPAGIASLLATRKVVLLAWQQDTCVRSAGHRSAALWTGENRFTYICHLEYFNPKTSKGQLIVWAFLLTAAQLKSLTWVATFLLFVFQKLVKVQWCVVSIGRWWRCGGPQYSPHQSLQTDGKLPGQVSTLKLNIKLW